MSGVMSAVAASVEAALHALLDPAGTLSAELTAITNLLAATLPLLSDVLALTVNAQNHLPGVLPSASTVAGQFEVTAPHVGVIGARPVRWPRHRRAEYSSRLALRVTRSVRMRESRTS